MRHVHQWRIYTPPPSTKQGRQIYFEFQTLPERDLWTHRRCDCGAKMRCLTKALAAYPKGFLAFADEEWENES
jgi:hypothetical protein